MARRRNKVISVRASESELASIVEIAGRHHLPVSDFVRSAALEAVGACGFYSDDDRRLLLYLRDELKQEGFNLTAILIALNRDRNFSSEEVKDSILAMQQAIAALSVEILGLAKFPARSSRGGAGA
ncbi:hypothetical protein [Neorhizobium sp. NCHU2750]|uniref:plasmid mobilization protein n=1 Tax=Neorhizobium sp. NCHU2750 TaxID=1825976 RepID=UPI000E7502D9|nr:hypothetical protein NCHU2750_11710 [Neorhizobium sp. NCHU2750]